VFAVAAGSVQAKEAAPPSIWQGCGDNVVSGMAKFMVGPTAARATTPTVAPSEGVQRCTAALQALAADAPWQRRAALLRSRAKFLVLGSQHGEALADLDAIARIEQPDATYARSFGVSLHMLRAVAHLQAGGRDEASAEAFTAMRLRPWSERVAQFAYAISALRWVPATGEGPRWDNLVRIEPTFLERRALLLSRAGDWAAATADWQRSPLGPGAVGTSYVQLPNVTVQGAPGIPVKGADVPRTVNAAIAAAMAGRGDLADAWLARLDESLKTPPEPDGFAKRLGAVVDPQAQVAELARWRPLVEVARVAGAGNAAGAADRFGAMQSIPINDITAAMLRTIVAKLPEAGHPELRRLLVQIEEKMLSDRNERILKRFEPATLLYDLPDHEEVMLANPYRNAVKFLRANGFSVKANPDGKGAVISFFGNRSQPFAIGEMTLLRAAEFVIERGQTAFRVVSSDDYTQTQTMTMYGAPVGPTTVSGHSTSLTVEFVDPAAAGAIDPAEVRAALGPIYVKPAEG
jgi:hypothetical protein